MNLIIYVVNRVSGVMASLQV